MPSSEIYLTKTICLYYLAFCPHIKVCLKLYSEFFLTFLSHIYIDIVGGASFLNKNSFPTGVGTGTDILIQNGKIKVHFIYYVCRYVWYLGRVSILYKINSAERKQLNLSAKTEHFFQNAVILQIFIVSRGPLWFQP